MPERFFLRQNKIKRNVSSALCCITCPICGREKSFCCGQTARVGKQFNGTSICPAGKRGACMTRVFLKSVKRIKFYPVRVSFSSLIDIFQESDPFGIIFEGRFDEANHVQRRIEGNDSFHAKIAKKTQEKLAERQGLENRTFGIMLLIFSPFVVVFCANIRYL